MTTTVSTPVSINAAVRRSGRSDKTIRRWIKAGRLRAAKTERGYQVNAEDLSTLSRIGSTPLSTPNLDTGVDNEREDVQPAASPGTDIMRAEAMAAYTRSILEPLVARMAEQDGVIREQAEQLGTLRAELAASEARFAALVASTAERPPNPSPGEPPPPADPSPVLLPPTPNGAWWWRRTLAWLYG